MRGFKLLTPKEIECRISEIDKQGRFLTLLLYKTARTDMAKLDEHFGIDGWANDYKVVDDKLFCGIGFRSNNGEWIWKWNNGTESNQDAEKGHASDAFKRAGFMLGIGTELYSAPRIKVGSDRCTIKDYNGKYRCYDSFEVSNIAYDSDENISSLEITCNGKVCFTWKNGRETTTPITPKQEAPRAEQKVTQFKTCKHCGKPIKDGKKASGKVWPALEIAKYARDRWGMELCYDCAGEAAAVEKAEAQQAVKAHEDGTL